jgi:hypothetical protein
VIQGLDYYGGVKLSNELCGICCPNRECVPPLLLFSPVLVGGVWFWVIKDG